MNLHEIQTNDDCDYRLFLREDGMVFSYPKENWEEPYESARCPKETQDV